jgi:uncharacterized membrane protein YbhN (UPF0104 family)
VPIQLYWIGNSRDQSEEGFSMVFLSSNRIRRAVTAVILLVAIAFSLAGLNLVHQSLDGRLFDPVVLIALLPFAIWSFGLRALRWHALARSLKPGLSPLVSGYVQLVGFSFSVTPGRVAELYKLKVLERSSGISVAQSLPAVVVERLTDAMALTLLVAVGGILHWSAAVPAGSALPLIVVVGIVVLTVAVLLPLRGRARTNSLSPLGEGQGEGVPTSRHVGIALAVFSRQGLLIRSRALLDRSPIGRRLLQFLANNRVSSTLTQLKDGSVGVTRPGTLALALLLVALGRLGDGALLWKIGQLVGYPIPFSLAMLIMGTTGLVGGISLSPGGVGAAEAALVALIVAHGIPLAVAVVATFTARTLLFWLWVVLGLCVFAASQLYHFVKDIQLRENVGLLRLKPVARRSVERGG